MIRFVMGIRDERRSVHRQYICTSLITNGVIPIRSKTIIQLTLRPNLSIARGLLDGLGRSALKSDDLDADESTYGSSVLPLLAFENRRELSWLAVVMEKQMHFSTVFARINSESV